MPDAATFESALLLAGFAVLFAYLPHGLVGDDFTRFADIERLIHHGSLSGTPFSLVMPLASAPLLLLGEVVRTPEWWAARFNILVAGAGALAVFGVLRGRIDRSLLRRILLLLLFASFLTNRLRDYNAEVFTATLVTIGLVYICLGRRPLLAWSAIVVGVVNTPAALLGGALLAGAECVRTRRLRYLLAPAAAAFLIMGEAWLRRGGPFATGQGPYHAFDTVMPYSGREGFSYPLLFGVLSIVFSFGRGLVFFTPGILFWLSAWSRRVLEPYRRLVGLMLLYVAGLVLVYAKWWAWNGGLSWGPRYFVLAAVPSSALIAVRLVRAGERPLGDALTLGALVLSAWVGVNGAIADLATLDFCARNSGQYEALCWYTPEFSSLGHPFVRFSALSWQKGVVAAFCAIVFAYLAAPLVAGLVRWAVGAVRPRAWVVGWRL